MSNVFPIAFTFRAHALHVAPLRQVSRLIQHRTFRPPTQHITSQLNARFASTTRQSHSRRQLRAPEKQAAPKISEELWRRYDPAGGLPLPNGELPAKRIAKIFGDEIDVDNGNYILAVLHWRRMSGALIDNGIDFPKSSTVTRDQALKGLEYLRTTIPNVDEQALGAKWVEEETQRVRTELQDRAVKLRLYKPDPSSVEDAATEEPDPLEEDESQQGTAYGRARSGTSALEGLRGANRAKTQAQEDKRAVELAHKERSLLHKARGPLELAGGLQSAAGVKRYGSFAVVLTQPETAVQTERAPWVQYWEEKAQVTDNTSAPTSTVTRRLVPSFLVMVTTVGLCVYLSNVYTPPPLDSRLFPSIPSGVATLGGITTLLLTTFVLSRLPPLWWIASRYFCIVPAYPFAISNLGAILRHDTLAHLAANVITMWVVGLPLHENVGRGTFLAIFVGTGAVGSFTSLTYNVLTKQWAAYIFGSSGAILGLFAAQCTLRPMTTIKVYGYDLPLALWMLLLMVGGAETYAAVRLTTSGLDHFGHLGGLVSGSAAAFYLRWKMSTSKTQSPVMTRETS